MKARFDEEHYRRCWEEYLKPVNSDHYMNLERDLSREMEVYEKALAGLPEGEANLAKIRRVKATEIIEKVTPKLKETMATIKRIEAGNGSLGYTTDSAERRNMADLVQRFEFNCLQLADFKKKYLS